MKTRWLLAIVIIGWVACAQAVRAESGHRLGVGANYWKMLDDIDVGNMDENGVSWLVTYQYEVAALLKLEADVEVFPSGFQGADQAVYAPEAYLVLGSLIYAGAGVGILYADSEFADDPFYALRAGLDLELLPRFHLDLNVNYRFVEWAGANDMAEDISADTMTAGAAVRFEL